MPTTTTVRRPAPLTLQQVREAVSIRCVHILTTMRRQPGKSFDAAEFRVKRHNVADRELTSMALADLQRAGHIRFHRTFPRRGWVLTSPT